MADEINDTVVSDDTASSGADAAEPTTAEEGPSNRRLMRQLGPAGVLAILWAAMPGILGIYLLARIDPVSEWLQSHGSAGLFLYTGVFIVSAGFGLLPTYAQAILGGWVFGIALGLPAALVGFTGAAMIGYGLTRFIARDRVERAINEHPRAQVIRDALIGQKFWKTLGIIALVRVPPNSPFALTNLALSSAGARVVPYALGTLIGMTPRTAVAIVLASIAAENADGGGIGAYLEDGTGRMYFIGGIVVFVVVLMVISRVANKALDRATRSVSTADESDDEGTD